MSSSNGSKQSVNALALSALGIVFGDIGTSPLYAVREAFEGEHALSVTPENILGILSLIVWSLVVVISVKYLMFVMRADNNGEGGVMALTSLAAPKKVQKRSRAAMAVLYMGLFGSALLFGDGIITPAISVMSAVEGLKIATPFFDTYVVPITIGILAGLFYAQKQGTASIGKVFGPIILIWFLVLAGLGLHSCLQNVFIFSAINPIYAIQFFGHNGWAGILALGAVFLVCTGGEALYADMGHFGRSPIVRAWFIVALPALLLNYFGQGALLLQDPSAVHNPFYSLVPQKALYPMVILATAATVIASQALISGVFSLTRQAVQLGYIPRLRIIHTSSVEIGQIYIPWVNWLLFFLTAWLVFSFKSSSALASAYGIAVSLTMVITTVLTCTVAYRLWKWSLPIVILVLSAFLFADSFFLIANFSKIIDGGWVPLSIGSVILLLMTTWRTGRRILKIRLRKKSLRIESLIAQLKQQSAKAKVPGTAVFMTGDQRVAPLALVHNLTHNKVLHTKNILLTIISKDVPHIPRSERIEIEHFEFDFSRVVARYGFMDSPKINDILDACADKELIVDREDITFFVGRETIIPSDVPGMAIWREQLFAIMSRNAEKATAYFNIPASQVIEVGLQVEI